MLIEATKTLQALEFWASNDFSLKYALASKMQWAAKGQTKLKWFFQADVSSIKQMNEFDWSTMTCFHSFFGRNWRHQKDISKLTDL